MWLLCIVHCTLCNNFTPVYCNWVSGENYWRCSYSPCCTAALVQVKFMKYTSIGACLRSRAAAAVVQIANILVHQMSGGAKTRMAPCTPFWEAQKLHSWIITSIPSHCRNFISCFAKCINWANNYTMKCDTSSPFALRNFLSRPTIPLQVTPSPSCSMTPSRGPQLTWQLAFQSGLGIGRLTIWGVMATHWCCTKTSAGYWNEMVSSLVSSLLVQERKRGFHRK